MDKAKKILQIALLALCCLLVLVLIPVAIIVGHNVRLFLQRSTATMENVRETSEVGKNYIDHQVELFESPPYQKSIKASIDTPAVWNASGRYLNTQILPEARGLIIGLRQSNTEITGLIGDSRKLVTTSTTLLANFDKSLNTDLLPSVKTLADSLNVKASDLSDALVEAVWSGQMTLDEAQKLVSNPDIPAAIKELRGSSADFHEATGSFKKGFENFPAMFTAWRKYSEAATTWQKRIYLARLLAIIAGIPGLL